uniref:Remorin C-terminal domain-containing protein n=1 Tax=Brassica campestris TaxID=3711 RepID=A0A3P6AVG4_BRACM|nr:unnamed protein product [Brassica rapa]
MGPAVELWKEREMDKTRKKYERLSEKIMLWEEKKKKKKQRESFIEQREVLKRQS